MLGKKREYILYSFYDRTGIERHLEQMAAKGLMLVKMGRTFWTYRRMEPRAMHFSIVYFAPASEFDCAPGEEQQTFQDYCAAAYGPNGSRNAETVGRAYWRGAKNMVSVAKPIISGKNGCLPWRMHSMKSSLQK